MGKWNSEKVKLKLNHMLIDHQQDMLCEHSSLYHPFLGLFPVGWCMNSILPNDFSVFLPLFLFMLS